MPAWWKVVWIAVLMVLPGGFFILAGYVLTQALKEAWQRAATQAQMAGQHLTFRAVVDNLRFRDTWRQLRTSGT